MKLIKPAAVVDGSGAILTRIIGNQALPQFDPFLLLDFFSLKLPAGFPDHPHRGFESVTYIMKGSLLSQSSIQSRFQVNAGQIQHMVIGKGLQHCQIPSSSSEPTVGIQLWINLQNKMRLCPSSSKHFDVSNFQPYESENVRVKVLLGQFRGITSPVHPNTKTMLLDFAVKSQSQDKLIMKISWATLIYVYRGRLQINQTFVQEGTAGYYCKETPQEIWLRATQEASCFVLSGERIQEPTLVYGCFAMSSRLEIEKTIMEYHAGRNGFENKEWSSELKDSLKESRNKASFYRKD